MLPNDPKQHFQGKNELAREEISDDPVLIAIYFKEKNARGVLVATQVKSKIGKVMDFPPHNFCICGVGNNNEFEEIIDFVEKSIHSFDRLYGMENFGVNFLLHNISEYLREYYMNGPKALGVELLLMVYNDPQIPTFFSGYRIKSDGDYHPVDYYAVIGGYNKKKDESIRSIIMKELKSLYVSDKKLPTYKEAIKITKRLCALGPEGQYGATAFQTKLANIKKKNRNKTSHPKSSNQTSKSADTSQNNDSQIETKNPAEN